ncbi:MAG: DUF2934 domain-containing protein [Methylosarcina sp.]
MNEENKSLSLGSDGVLDPDTFYEMVKERAFFKAEKRGFEPGHEMEDWCEAEKEIRNQCHYWSQEVD